MVGHDREKNRVRIVARFDRRSHLRDPKHIASTVGDPPALGKRKAWSMRAAP